MRRETYIIITERMGMESVGDREGRRERYLKRERDRKRGRER